MLALSTSLIHSSHEEKRHILTRDHHVLFGIDSPMLSLEMEELPGSDVRIICGDHHLGASPMTTGHYLEMNHMKTGRSNETSFIEDSKAPLSTISGRVPISYENARHGELRHETGGKEYPKMAVQRSEAHMCTNSHQKDEPLCASVCRIDEPKCNKSSCNKKNDTMCASVHHDTKECNTRIYPMEDLSVVSAERSSSLNTQHALRTSQSLNQIRVCRNRVPAVISNCVEGEGKGHSETVTDKSIVSLRPNTLTEIHNTHVNSHDSACGVQENNNNSYKDSTSAVSAERKDVLSNQLANKRVSFQMDGMWRASTQSLWTDSSTKPNIHVKLFRAKSSTAMLLLENASAEDSIESDVDVSKLGKENSPISHYDKESSDDHSHKSERRKSRFGKILSLLSKKPKASTSLPNLGRQLPTKPSKSNKACSNTNMECSGGSSSESLTDACEEIKRHHISDMFLEEANRSRSDLILEENEKSDNDHVDDDKSDEEMGDDVLTLENRTVSDPLPIPYRERTYSLIGSDNSRDDASTHVAFTRIPSLRGKQVTTRLMTHFSTISSNHVGEDEQTQTIKDATHIQPLASGEAIVTDTLSNRIVLYDKQGEQRIVFTVESGSEPWSVCILADGNMAVTLKRQGCVAMWATSGVPMIEFGQATLSAPTGIVCDGRGRLVITDEEANRVYIFNTNGKLITELQGPRTATAGSLPASFPDSSCSASEPPPCFNKPRYACVTPEGNYVISDSANHCVKIFDSDGHYVNEFGGYGRTPTKMKFPYGVTCDDAGNIYVADHYNNRVSLFSKNGDFIEEVLNAENDDITRPKSVAIMDSKLYVTYGDLRANKVAVFSVTQIRDRKLRHV